MTTGIRAEFPPEVLRATDLPFQRHNHWVKVAGCVIVRQRPGTAKGFVFLSLEDETGVANIIMEPDVFERERDTVVNSSILLIEGVLSINSSPGQVACLEKRGAPLAFCFFFPDNWAIMRFLLMAEATSNIDRLEQRLQANWTHIKAARQLAASKRAELRTLLAGLDSDDTSIVVSGSLARDEFTDGSDIDWTLLIDGSADPRHYDLVGQIKTSIDRVAVKQTGAEGLFSSMVFSHELIHQIGGEDDTNTNTTRRLLLLLESCAVGREAAHRRVTRNILNRYLLEDRGFWKGSPYRIPRFLQNDFARYWRTIAVDFAYKVRRRSGKGSAIRNAKLRMSRKLIYVSGLLACFGCHLDHTPDQWNEMAGSADRREQTIDYFRGVFRQTPLEIIASMLLRFNHLDNASRQVFGSYDEFLGLLANQQARERLETIKEDEAESDGTCRQAKSLSHTFRDGLLTIFFDPQSGLDDLTKNYGVF